MQKFIINWNCGFGSSDKLIEAENKEEAEKIAYEACREDFESQAEYEALPFTLENAENYGYEEKHPDYKKE